ncbi:MAG: 30S ribosomal protein S2 [Candidatus Methylacidiphilales bacterium]
MAKPDIKDLLEAGVHFGHRTEKWNPKMKPFIFEARNGIHVINLNKTVEQLEAARQFLRELTSKGGKILFVGCKKQAQEAVVACATHSNSFYVSERWLGGTLTNLNTIRKSVARLKYIESLESQPKAKNMTKQELGVLRREAQKIQRHLGGIKEMEKVPDCLVIVDLTRETIAVQEAARLNIPVVAITDTNADPNLARFPIPGNDDAIRSIRVLLDVLTEAIVEGNQRRSKADRESKKTSTDAPNEFSQPQPESQSETVTA